MRNKNDPSQNLPLFSFPKYPYVSSHSLPSSPSPCFPFLPISIHPKKINPIPKLFSLSSISSISLSLSTAAAAAASPDSSSLMVVNLFFFPKYGFSFWVGIRIFLQFILICHFGYCQRKSQLSHGVNVFVC